MLIYSASKSQFDDDVLSDKIASKVKHGFYIHGLFHDNKAEYDSWKNSLSAMQKVLSGAGLPEGVQIAVEYQIPLTSKRVDLLIAGEDAHGANHVIVVELKQWEEARHTSSDGIVTAFTGGMNRAVAHPSYQAYSYAKTIENFNATVQDDKITLHPCAYLHNFKKSQIEEIKAPIYQEAIDLAPLFIKGEEKKFQGFIKKYIVSPPQKDLLSKIENGKIRSSKALQDTVVSMITGNEEFIMLDEQKVVYEAVKNLISYAQNDGKKRTIIVEGGPGTGKSVVAIQLLSHLIANKEMTVSYVTKNAAPRNVYFDKLKRGKALNNYVKELFKSSGVFYTCDQDMFDCLIVDEAHRLNAKSGLYESKGENQIKEIINASKVSVFFIDEAQVVTSSDIGSVVEIKRWANILGSQVFSGEQYKLSSQFRCNGSDSYIAFLDDLLGIRKTAHYDGFDLEYELKIFDDPMKMREELYIKNMINNKARMLAGYCYAWPSKKSNDLAVFDIELNGGFRARWNFNNTSTWAIDQDSFEQVGCIHTSQGLEFDYVGIIIGKDLRFENGQVITDPTKRAKSDRSLRGLKSRATYLSDADRIIRNTYKTLMTRAQKGCYIYCEDTGLQEYIKHRLTILKKG